RSGLSNGRRVMVWLSPSARSRCLLDASDRATESHSGAGIFGQWQMRQLLSHLPAVLASDVPPEVGAAPSVRLRADPSRAARFVCVVGADDVDGCALVVDAGPGAHGWASDSMRLARRRRPTSTAFAAFSACSGS